MQVRRISFRWIFQSIIDGSPSGYFSSSGTSSSAYIQQWAYLFRYIIRFVVARDDGELGLYKHSLDAVELPREATAGGQRPLREELQERAIAKGDKMVVPRRQSVTKNWNARFHSISSERELLVLIVCCREKNKTKRLR
uniref:Uncharacterized protein n=1 Tax=Ananas comosus var. bracteatus TaxID=296719 RepID=A0A6V7PB04_ANACO|nr:unnamed protein product [Ananas comosus var. bracteatus]